MQPTYNKPATSISDQILLLQKRGLTIQDVAEAEHYLTQVGYYRLAGYWQIFQADKVRHLFIAGTRFRHIVELYEFDRRLRGLLFDAIERIEISVRALLVHEMSMAYGPQWYEADDLAEKRGLFIENLEKIVGELNRSHEEFVVHHDAKYGKTYPPAWKAMQVISLGTLSKIYSSLRNSLPEKKLIAKKFGLPAPKWLESWLQVVNVLRNQCAHHCRVCYKRFGYPPKYMHKSLWPWLKKQAPAESPIRELVYYQICTVKFLLDRCSPMNDFAGKLKALLMKFPSIDLQKMGFPEDWAYEDLWTGTSRHL